ncbi:MAG: flagellin, partial [Candidatus Eisenbacteria bacterium]
ATLALRASAAIPFACSMSNGVITARQAFVTGMINTLSEGADQLTVADQNEEAANMLALQTRQQLGITGLSLASQSSQSILSLF